MAALLSAVAPALAMDVEQVGTKLIVTGENFRYTWDARRGGEMSVVEQRSLPTTTAWWVRANRDQRPTQWHRVNSTFAWKSLDTIPAVSFSTKRGSYYSGEPTIAYANADRNATLKVVRKSAQEVVFETAASPKILENLRLPVPWKVRQTVRVFDSGVVLTELNIDLPKDEVYELDWSQMAVNMDDSLFKEPNPDKQNFFNFGWGLPGGEEISFGRDKAVIQDLEHLPLDIDVKLDKCVRSEKPMLFGCAAYELTHIKGSPANAFAEFCLEEARSLTGTKEDFGSLVLIRPQSGMSPVPTWAGSMRGNPCFSMHWNLFDGKAPAGLNEPLSYRNRLAFAVASRKRSNLPDAKADDRNILLGARIYYAKDKLPSADDIKAMAAQGCDTLILGALWRKDETAAGAAVQAARAAGMRVGAAVDARELKTLMADDKWFTKHFQKDRDGLLVLNAHLLLNAPAKEEFQAMGEKVSFKTDENYRVNAAGFALCMRALREMVGPKGFLVGGQTPLPPSLLSMAEFDLHMSSKLQDFRWGNSHQAMMRRHFAGAGFAPNGDALPADWLATAIAYGDTPIINWPAQNNEHVKLWQLFSQLPAKGFRSELSLLPTERHFTTSSEDVSGMLCDGGDGKMVLLLGAMKAGGCKVSLTLTAASVKDSEGKDVPVAGGAFDAGQFTAGQVKLFNITASKEAAK